VAFDHTFSEISTPAGNIYEMMKELEDCNERAANEFSRKMRWASTKKYLKRNI
jgi:hypothetical protein